MRTFLISFRGFDQYDERQSFNVKGSMWTPEGGYDKSTKLTSDGKKFPLPAVGSGNEVADLTLI